MDDVSCSRNVDLTRKLSCTFAFFPDMLPVILYFMTSVVAKLSYREGERESETVTEPGTERNKKRVERQWGIPN